MKGGHGDEDDDMDIDSETGETQRADNSVPLCGVE